MVFIDDDGTFLGRRVVDLPGDYRLYAASESGSAPRFLLAASTYVNEVVTSRIAIVDGEGEVIARDVNLPPMNGIGAPRFAAGGDDEFLLIRVASNRAFADRVSGDGVVASSNEIGALPLFNDAQLARSRTGWILGLTGFSDPYSLYALEHDGTMRSSSPAYIPADLPGPAFSPRLEQDGDRIILTWSTPEDEQRWSLSLVAEVTAEGQVVNAREIVYAPGRRPAPLVERVGGRLLAFYDSMAVRLGPANEPESYSLLAVTAPRQKNAAVASGANGFLTGWVEEGRGAFVRRQPIGLTLSARGPFGP